jgi:hypothetical protein
MNMLKYADYPCYRHNDMKTYEVLEVYHYALLAQEVMLKTKTKLHGLSPRANYTDRATAGGNASGLYYRGAWFESLTSNILCFLPGLS